MYYKLICLASPDRKQVGDVVFAALKPLDIGQLPSCEMRIKEPFGFEPEIMASILPASDGNGWIIVRRSDNCRIMVDGAPLGICRSLASKSKLCFEMKGERTDVSFLVSDDGEYDTQNGFVYKKHPASRRLLYATFATAALAVVIAVVSVFAGNSKNILRQENFDVFDKSIFCIVADSVALVRDTVIDGRGTLLTVESAAIEVPVSGTCFLTDNGLLVTARHCVEPWINDENWENVGTGMHIPPHIRLAAKAETLNRLSGAETYSVRAHCVVSNGMETYQMYSSDFCFNKTRDKVVRLGTEEEPLYWRTIMPLAMRRDMELGDFAYTELGNGVTGAFSLATMNEMLAFDKQADKDIAVIGFPVNDNGTGNVCVRLFGNSQHLETDADNRFMGCIQMSADVNPGNSGGPVVARVGSELKVVAIVSKGDGKATQGVFWAVPSTEVLELYDNGGKTNDSIIYRR